MTLENNVQMAYDITIKLLSTRCTTDGRTDGRTHATPSVYLNPFAVRTSLTQFAFGAGVLGGGHHLHRLCDFLNVRHGLQTHRDLFKSGHGSILLLNGGGGALAAVSRGK